MKNFSNATTHSFEVWIRIQKGHHKHRTRGARGSAYWCTSRTRRSRVTGGGGLGNASLGKIRTSGQNWGAENRDGTSGANISPAPPNGHEFSINTARRRPVQDEGRQLRRLRWAAGHLHFDRQHDVEHHTWNHTETGNADGYAVACFHSY